MSPDQLRVPFVSHVIQFTMAAHYDGPDALALVIEALNTRAAWVADPDATPPLMDADARHRLAERHRQEMLDEESHPAWTEIARG